MIRKMPRSWTLIKILRNLMVQAKYLHLPKVISLYQLTILEKISPTSSNPYLKKNLKKKHKNDYTFIKSWQIK